MNPFTSDKKKMRFNRRRHRNGRFNGSDACQPGSTARNRHSREGDRVSTENDPESPPRARDCSSMRSNSSGQSVYGSGSIPPVGNRQSFQYRSRNTGRQYHPSNREERSKSDEKRERPRASEESCRDANFRRQSMNNGARSNSAAIEMIGDLDRGPSSYRTFNHTGLRRGMSWKRGRGKYNGKRPHPFENFQTRMPYNKRKSYLGRGSSMKYLSGMERRAVPELDEASRIGSMTEKPRGNRRYQRNSIFNGSEHSQRYNSEKRQNPYLKQFQYRNAEEECAKFYNSKAPCTVTSGALMDINLDPSLVFPGKSPSGQSLERNHIPDGIDRTSATFSFNSVSVNETTSEKGVGGESNAEIFQNNITNEKNRTEFGTPHDWQKVSDETRDNNQSCDINSKNNTFLLKELEKGSLIFNQIGQGVNQNMRALIENWGNLNPGGTTNTNCNPDLLASVQGIYLTNENAQTISKETVTCGNVAHTVSPNNSNSAVSPKSIEISVTTPTQNATHLSAKVANLELVHKEAPFKLHDPRLNHPSYMRTYFSNTQATGIQPEPPVTLSENGSPSKALDYSEATSESMGGSDCVVEAVSQLIGTVADQKAESTPESPPSPSPFMLLQSNITVTKPNPITSKLELWDEIQIKSQTSRTLAEWRRSKSIEIPRTPFPRRPVTTPAHIIKEKYPNLVDTYGMNWVIDVLSIDDDYLEARENQILSAPEHRDFKGAHEALRLARDHRQQLKKTCEDYAKMADHVVEEFEKTVKRCLPSTLILQSQSSPTEDNDSDIVIENAE